jgi:cell wall-associated NlpC family hydrolase
VTGRLNARTLRALGVMSSVARTRAATDAPSSETATKAVAAVKSHIGASYASGATGPDSFDCSGLTMTSYGEAGVKLPRTSFDQYGEGTAVAHDDIQPGDLVFFDSAGSGASHVAIAVSDDTVVSATSSGGVMEHPIDDSYWGGHYVGARRVA